MEISRWWSEAEPPDRREKLRMRPGKGRWNAVFIRVLPVSLPMLSVPFVRVVVPEQMLLPRSVRLPVPFCVTAPVPEITPPIVVAFARLLVSVKVWRFTAPLMTRFPEVAFQFWLAPSLIPLPKVSVPVLLFVMPLLIV